MQRDNVYANLFLDRLRLKRYNKCKTRFYRSHATFIDLRHFDLHAWLNLSWRSLSSLSLSLSLSLSPLGTSN